MIQPGDEELDRGYAALRNNVVLLSSLHMLNVSFDYDKDVELFDQSRKLALLW